MTEDLTQKDPGTAVSDPRLTVRRISWLLLLDILLVVSGSLYNLPDSRFLKTVLGLLLVLHLPVILLTGYLLTRIYRNRLVLALYWIAVASPLLSIIPPLGLFAMFLSVPFGPYASTTFVPWLITAAVLGQHYGKGRWPLPLSALILVGVCTFLIYNLIFKTTEFGPLGMLFVNMFATPFFLILPALLRIPAQDTVKRYVVGVQYTVYGLTALFWVVFLLRTSLR